MSPENLQFGCAVGTIICSIMAVVFSIHAIRTNNNTVKMMKELDEELQKTATQAIKKQSPKIVAGKKTLRG